MGGWAIALEALVEVPAWRVGASLARLVESHAVSRWDPGLCDLAGASKIAGVAHALPSHGLCVELYPIMSK